MKILKVLSTEMESALREELTEIVPADEHGQHRIDMVVQNFMIVMEQRNRQNHIEWNKKITAHQDKLEIVVALLHNMFPSVEVEVIQQYLKVAIKSMTEEG